jgi:hypothetical protein
MRDGKHDSLQFMFYGGEITDEQVALIKIPKDEILEFRFLKLEQADGLLSEHLRRRFLASFEALSHSTVAYLESR